MHFIDICAAMSAYKHARSAVVTASIDHLNFLSPAKKGDILILKVSTGLLPIYAINYPYVCSSTDMIVSTELAVSETTFIMSPVSNTSF